MEQTRLNIDIESKFKALKAALTKFLTDEKCIIWGIVDSYFRGLNVDTNYNLTLSEKSFMF